MWACIYSCAGLGTNVWLLIHPTTPAFHLSSTHFFSTLYSYLFWLVTSYGCPSFMMSMWSYHWRSRYPFVSMPLWEWTYNNPQYISGYYRSYCFGEWSTCSKGGFPPFPSPHPMMTPNNEWISLSLKMVLGLCWTLSLLIQFA